MHFTPKKQHFAKWIAAVGFLIYNYNEMLERYTVNKYI